MAKVSHKSIVEAPRDVVFAYVNGYENVPKFMFGITRFDPLTEHTVGLGTRFAAAMNVGPKTLKSTVETMEWIENELIRLEAVEGFEANTTWRFADGDGGTEVHVEFDYRLPGGLAGRALGTVLEPFMGQAIKHTDANLSAQVKELG